MFGLLLFLGFGFIVWLVYSLLRYMVYSACYDAISVYNKRHKK